jgi:C4-dicarboxylate-specific signal transduction histidine kinase
MLEILIQWTVWAATLGVAFWVVRRLQAQVAQAGAEATTARAEAKRAVDARERDLKVAEAKTESVRRELEAEVERLHREVFCLETEAEARAKYDVCHRCEQPKGKPQPEQRPRQVQRFQRVNNE